jgi:hypothetical protein
MYPDALAWGKRCPAETAMITAVRPFSCISVQPVVSGSINEDMSITLNHQCSCTGMLWSRRTLMLLALWRHSASFCMEHPCRAPGYVLQR